ncbi:hypothetical protein ASE78_07560 [Sphingomonas sp. Leaf25]|nr:hypothetical protein ASE78_07560 [Sphingomonas sp. Leaf25]
MRGAAVHSTVSKYWRIAVALAPSIVLGAVMRSWLQAFGYSRLESLVIRCAAGVAIAIVLLWLMDRLLPGSRNNLE